MAQNERTNTHPAWEDLIGFGLGVLVVLSPYFSGDTADFSWGAPSSPVQLVTTLIGLVILVSAYAERIQVLERAEEPSREWAEVLDAALGALLFALPFILGYAGSGTLRYWHFALGGIVFLLAIFELRRDYVGETARRLR